jgi:L-fucose isomerase-like protein
MTRIPITLGLLPSRRVAHTAWTERMRTESLALLAGLPGARVVAPAVAEGDAPDPTTGATPHGTVRTLDEAETVAALFRREGVDALVICPLDFGDERSAVKVAECLGVPTLLYATAEPPARDDASLARVSDSYCGTLSIAAGLTRRRLPFRFAGIHLPTDAPLAAEAETFLRAVGAVKALRGARIGQVGVRPAAFESVAYDEVSMACTFGQNVVPANLADVVDAAQSLADDAPEVLARVAEIRAGVAEVTVSDTHLLRAAKVELALEGFFRRERLSAMAAQCWPSIQRMMGVSLCAVYGRLTGRHLLTACEVDVLGALSMLANYGAALGEALPHFIDWTIQHREDPNLLLAWHCGNAPTCLAADPSRTALRSRRDMRGELPVPEEDPQAGLYQFQIKPGPVTLCRMAEYDGEWKMLVARGDIVPSEETLAGTWSWVRVADHARLYRTLVEEGFIHHASLIHGDQVAALTEACRFLGVRSVVVE